MIGERDVYFPVVSEVILTQVYIAEKLEPGARFAGPAVVQATTTTLVVNPGDEVRCSPTAVTHSTIGVETHRMKTRRPTNVVPATS